MPLKCTVSKNDIQESLASLQTVTGKKATLAILSNVLIEGSSKGLTLTGTDLEVGMRFFIPANVKESGTITLPSKKIFEIVRESGSDEIYIEESQKSWVVIKAGLSTYNLAGAPSDEFPEFPEYEEESFLSPEASVLADLIDKVIYSTASEQENMYMLTSVLFEREKREGGSCLRMVASDGHRLSVMERNIAVDVDEFHMEGASLIPEKGIQELKKFCEHRNSIKISFEKKQCIVRDENAVMVVRLKDGEFIRYRDIVKAVQFDNYLEIKRIPFLESLRRIDIFTEDVSHTIQLEIDAEKMVFSSQNADIGNAKDEQAIEYSGENIKAVFNCRYFIQALQVMKCEKVRMYIYSDKDPCLLKSESDEGFLAVIMPMNY